MQKKLKRMILLCLVLILGTWGCSSVRMTMTERSILEQQLMVQGLLKALEDIDLTQFYGKKVTLEVSGLAEEEVAFTEKYLYIHLGKHGIRIVADPQNAELNLKVLAPILAAQYSAFCGSRGLNTETALSGLENGVAGYVCVRAPSCASAIACRSLRIVCRIGVMLR